jgi:hypothetical protein
MVGYSKDPASASFSDLLTYALSFPNNVIALGQSAYPSDFSIKAWKTKVGGTYEAVDEQAMLTKLGRAKAILVDRI